MVLGLKTRNRKSPYVHLDYIINLVEIKPWPPSQSLRSLRSALIQWEHGNKNSGSTKAVAPSIISTSGVGDGKIEFNESFRVHVTLSRDNDTFLRNCIEFNMYEPRRDKTVKGQLLASAILDFAEYGIVDKSLMISVPMNCKRTFGNTSQPMLFVKIQTVEKDNRVRMENNRSESVSALMNEEYAEEADTASVTDDDISSQSSMAAGSSTFGSNEILTPQRENGSEATSGTSGKGNDQEVLVKDIRAAISFYEAHTSLEESSRFLSSTDLSSQVENAHNSRFTMFPQKEESYSLKLTKSFVANNKTNEELNANSRNNSHVNLHEKVSGKAMESHIYELHGDFGSDADRLMNVKSASSSFDSGYSNGSVRTNKFKNMTGNEGKDVSKVQHLEQRIQVLESELREAAAIELSLYSVVAEHGSSGNKVHSPARRLSRLYLHACKDNSSRRASSARSIVSGLILVAKACGNDVSRLTFWLSNSIVLRAIVHKTFEKPNKWKNESSSKEIRSGLHPTSNEWNDPRMVTSALEKVESWIFSRIIESIWWQTLAPYMQSMAAKGMIKVRDSEFNTASQTTFCSCDHEQANSSLELWKTAFMDVCERICPVRAAGHDCGCLRVLPSLIMEQCTDRLDVAMFNAILRESEVPTDPISDPITDAQVLPIPSGKASFGAGALLKKTVGNWSRWLTDLVGIDENNSLIDENKPDYDENIKGYNAPFNSFRLLCALSELMMLPKDMLLSRTIRKEVCPTFGVQLIKKILDSFIPDEFCPDPIPEVVIEALDSEDLIESCEDCVKSLPCAAAPIVYHPPCASLIGCIFGDDGRGDRLSRSGSSILRKSNTSDDELDELDSPLTSIVDSSRTAAASTKPVWTLKDAGNRSTVRYQLLREVWMNSD